MKKIFKKISGWVKSGYQAIKPGKNAEKGAALGLYTVTGILWLLFVVITTLNIRDPWILVWFVAFTGALILAGILGIKLIKQIYSIPKLIKHFLIAGIPLMLFVTAFEPILLIALFIIAACSGAAFMVFTRTGFVSLTTPKKVTAVLGVLIGVAGIIYGLVMYIPAGIEGDEFINAAYTTESKIKHIKAASPGARGNYEVLSLTYGSGKDKHRSEYGEEVDIFTDSINGVAFIDSWDGFGGWWRTKYWGFDSKALPLNARVWYPEGEGPFPLALIVHGNHSMQDYSDPGYEYLGRLLASRGIILASVDENFINGSWTDLFGGLDTENDARGWLLLEHLRVWHEWNSNPESLFHSKIDTTRLALIGHSRGGEAIGHAAMFNALPYYPDDASIKFNYNFNIKGVVAIAPVDGQYEPGDSRTKFENVSYFVVHGAQDADVRSFMGSQQFERVKFTDSLYHFKTGLYIYGANHGQFNTTWGNNDTGLPFTGQLNLHDLLPGQDQRQIAEVYISAFLEATLNERHEYLPLFMDSRTGKDWIPETTYLHQFEDSNSSYLCTFDEDFDVITTKAGNGKVSSENLTVWREQEIQLKWQKKGSRAVFLGWNYEEFLEETEEDDVTDDQKEVPLNLQLPDSIVASYTIDFNPFIENVDSSSVLVFSMAESTEDSNPKISGKWISNDNEEEEEEEEEEDSELDNEEDEDAKGEEDDDDEEGEDEDEVEDPLNFSIELQDSHGNILNFPISDFSLLQREFDVYVWKIDFLKDDKESEKIFQIFQYPLNDLLENNPEFDISGIQTLRFIFDKSEKGVVVIDNIGFMTDLRRL